MYCAHVYLLGSVRLAAFPIKICPWLLEQETAILYWIVSATDGNQFGFFINSEVVMLNSFHCSLNYHFHVIMNVLTNILEANNEVFLRQVLSRLRNVVNSPVGAQHGYVCLYRAAA